MEEDWVAPSSNDFQMRDSEMDGDLASHYNAANQEDHSKAVFLCVVAADLVNSVEVLVAGHLVGVSKHLKAEAHAQHPLDVVLDVGAGKAVDCGTVVEAVVVPEVERVAEVAVDADFAKAAVRE